MPNTNTNNNKYQYKTIKKQQIVKLRTVKIAYWVFCASKHNKKFQILTFGEILTIRFPNFNRIRIPILFGFGKSCKYEYEYILFENICRIRIRISLFGLNYSNTKIIRSPLYDTRRLRAFWALTSSWLCPLCLHHSGHVTHAPIHLASQRVMSITLTH